MKKTLLAVALAAASTTAFADVSVSGHVNYVFGDIEDFTGNEDITVNDAITSQSRFRIKSSKEANGITYGSTQEFGLNGDSSTDVVGIRVNEFFLKGDFGKLSLGQGSEAGDGAAESDFSGTYLGNNAAYNTWGLSSAIGQIDGGRDERLRYDSPKLGGIFAVALDIDTNDDTSIAVRAGGSNWKAAVYQESRDANDSDEIGASVALKFGGFTAAAHYGEIDDNGLAAAAARGDIEFSRFILGYRSGPYSVAVDLATREQDASTGNAEVDHETTGLTFVYRPTGGVELYAGIRSVDDDDAAPSLPGMEDDGDGFLVGGRVKF